MNRPSITLNELGKGADIQVNSISGFICSNYYHIYSSIPKSRTYPIGVWHLGMNVNPHSPQSI